MNARIAGADRTKTNLNEAQDHWSDTLQVSAQRSRLHKLSITNLTASDVYVWVYDLASASASSTKPDQVLQCFANTDRTWDFGADGGLFQNGIGIVLSDVAPTTPATTPTAAGDDTAIVRVDYRNLP